MDLPWKCCSGSWHLPMVLPAPSLPPEGLVWWCVEPEDRGWLGLSSQSLCSSSVARTICWWDQGVPHETELHVLLQGLDEAALDSASWHFTLGIGQCRWAVTFTLWARRSPLTWQGEGVSLLSPLMSTQTLGAVSQQGLVLGHLLYDLVKLVSSLSTFLTGQR